MLLHAFPLDSGMFSKLVPLLVSHVRVVTIDLPGLGRSVVPSADPSMAAVGEGIVAVLDTLRIQSATVLGISTGGYVALEMARSSPDRLDALILSSTTSRLIQPDVPAERAATARRIESHDSTEPVAGSADEGIGSTAHRDQPELVDDLRRTIAAADPAGVAWLARAIAARSDASQTLVDYLGPVSLIFGDEDAATPPQRGQEMLELRRPGSTSTTTTTLTVLAETGHLTALEAPEPVADLVLDVIDRLG